jgi:hypothetical protein
MEKGVFRSQLPKRIAEAKETLACLTQDIATRDANADEEFRMTVGDKVYSGKGAREEASHALAYPRGGSLAAQQSNSALGNPEHGGKHDATMLPTQ